MKVLVTGAEGMLGRDMVSELNRTDHEVYATDLESMDITDVRAVRSTVTAIKPDIVVNCAAYTNVDGAETDVKTAMMVNGLGPRNLAITCEAIGAVLLHISTDYVFDGSKLGAYEIWDTPNPINVYGKSKLWGEKYVSSLMTRYFVVRTSWLFGHGGRNFVSTMLELAKHNESIRVVNDQYGCPTFTVDLARICIDLVETGCFGIYHATNDGDTTWYHFAKEILRQARIPGAIEPVSTEDVPRPAKRPKNSVMDKFPLTETIGSTIPEWRDALRRYLDRL